MDDKRRKRLANRFLAVGTFATGAGIAQMLSHGIHAGNFLALLAGMVTLVCAVWHFHKLGSQT